MKSALVLLFGILSSAAIGAQDRQSVTFQAFPPDYEVFLSGDRLSFTERDDGSRVYQLPTGSTRVNLTAHGSAPLSLSLDVKPGMGRVFAKLEPRTGPLALVAEAATGRFPRSLAFSADGKKLFVALQSDSGVDVFDIPSLKKVGRLAPPQGPEGGYTDVLVVGGELWIVQRDGRVHTFDAATLTYKDSKDLAGGGNAFLTDLGGGKIAIANWDNVSLSAVDVSVRKELNRLTVAGSMRGFAARQGTGYASLFDRGRLAVIDTATWKVKATWAAGSAPRPVAALASGVFVGDMGNASVLMLDPASGKLLKTIAVASNPHQMAVSADQSFVAVASRGKNNPSDYQLPGPEFGKVTLLSAQGEVLGSVWGRNQPTGLAFSADGRYLAFTDFLDGNVELYRINGR